LNRLWLVTDIQDIKEQTEHPASFWSALIESQKPVTLPWTYAIGKSFVPNPETTEKVYKRHCDYMRTEMVLLMEQVHCIQVEAFLERDNSTKWWELGVPRISYIEMVRRDKALEHIHLMQFEECKWPSLDAVEHISHAFASVNAFILGDYNAVFAKEFYVDQEETNTFFQASKVRNVVGVLPKNIGKIKTACNGLISELCEGSRLPMLSTSLQEQPEQKETYNVSFGQFTIPY
jgi:hypothetical protein